MVEYDKFREMAMSLPESTEEPHFEKTSFRVKKKIFATYDQKKNLVCLKLSEIDQNVFSAFDNSIIYPVPNKWGKQGWTFMNLKNVSLEMCIDALTTAYCAVAPVKLVDLVRKDT